VEFSDGFCRLKFLRILRIDNCSLGVRGTKLTPFEPKVTYERKAANKVLGPLGDLWLTQPKIIIETSVHHRNDHDGVRQYVPNTFLPCITSTKKLSRNDCLFLNIKEGIKSNARGCDAQTAAFSKKRCIRFDMNDMIAVIKPVEDLDRLPHY
jgi:hypothetical protein